MPPALAYHVVCTAACHPDCPDVCKKPSLFSWVSHTGETRQLPNEIFFRIFDHLDRKSLFLFSLTSSTAGSKVKGYLLYQTLVQPGQLLLKALQSDRSIQFYSASELCHKTLHSDRCTACNWFGRYVFLPTCERVCGAGLDDNVLLCTLDARYTSEFLQLSNERAADLPHFYDRNGRTYVISIKHILEGDNTADNNSPSLIGQLMIQRQLKTYVAGSNPFYIALPYLSNTGPDAGRACRGCKLVYVNSAVKLSAQGVSKQRSAAASPLKSWGAKPARVSLASVWKLLNVQ
ncbi:hypothetical protein PWT90_06433 [Aphanocladium album]|nr:hypothetical protein PWT90_06433 [Aphanocladium album]